jgi:hypothetical protein
MSSAVSIGPFIKVAAVIGVFWFTGLGGQIWDSWSHHYAKIQAENARVELIEKAAQAEVWPTLCPKYFEAGWFDRHVGYRRLNWCEAYRGKGA